MKTSHKLLLGLALFLVVLMGVSATVLRKQFDGIDTTNPRARWQTRPLPVFSAVVITGPTSAIVQIEQGETTRLLADTLNRMENTPYTYRVANDTLFLQVGLVPGWKFRPDATDDQAHTPQLVVQTPRLNTVLTTNADCQIVGWKSPSLTLSQRGQGGRIMLTGNTLDILSTAQTGKTLLVIETMTNRITNGNFTLLDSASLFQDAEFSGKIAIRAAPASTLRLRGKSLIQATRPAPAQVR